MSHALSDILSDRFEAEPEEILIIKSYILDNFSETVVVAIRDQQLIITTRSAALAGALRPHLFKLRKLCGTEKKLLIRIGH